MQLQASFESYTSKAMDKFWDSEDPLARCAAVKEPRTANTALLDYAAQGAAGGKRSLRALWKAYTETAQATDGKQTPPTMKWSTLSGWSVKYSWQLRCADFDMLQRAARMQEQQEQRAAMLERHAQLGRSLQRAGTLKLAQLLEDVSEMTPEQVRLFIQIGIQLERAASGLPEELVAIMGLTDEGLQARYADLLARIGSTASSDEESGA